MPKTDPQLKSNDCGISAVKTIFNIYEKDISRKYIEESIPVEEKGTRIADLKDFLNSNGFNAEFKLLDVNYINGNEAHINDLFPFIIPIQNKRGLHYVVINELKNKRFKVFDPSKGSQYFLTLQEIKKLSHFVKNNWDLAETEDRILAICSQDLKEYNINFDVALVNNGHASLFNKLTYFKYLKESFGFKNSEAEKNFLEDLLKNQEISSVPSSFKSL